MMIKVQVNKLNTLTGHKDCIYTVEKSGEENIFFSGAGDGFVVSWDLNDPEQGQMIAQVPKSVYAVHYFETENTLIFGQNFYGLHVIDLQTKKQKSMVRFTSAAIFDIKTVNGKIIAGTGDGAVTIINYDDLKVFKQIKPTTKSVRSIAILPEKQEVAIGFSDNLIRIYDSESFEEKKVLHGHKNSVFALKYSPESKYLISGGRDAHLKIWDVNNDYDLLESIAAHIYTIHHIDYRADGKYFVTGSMDKTIKVWDANEFRLLKVIDKARHAGHGSSVNKLFWSSYHEQLVACSDDRTISIWDLKFNNEL
jgi:WD40 repeat protein